MIDRLFPRSFDNAYRGHWLAIWLLIPIVALRLVIGFNSMVFTRAIATGADAIPVDLYGHGGAAMVLSLFALLGWGGFLLALQAVVVLIRYRTMIPAMYVLFLLQQIGVKVVDLTHPVASASSSGSHAASIMIGVLRAMTLIGFALSLIDMPAGRAKTV